MLMPSVRSHVLLEEKLLEVKRNFTYWQILFLNNFKQFWSYSSFLFSNKFLFVLNLGNQPTWQVEVFAAEIHNIWYLCSLSRLNWLLLNLPPTIASPTNLHIINTFQVLDIIAQFQFGASSRFWQRFVLMMRTFQRGDGCRSVKNSASNEIRAKTQFPVGSDRCEDYCKNQELDI